MKTLRSIVCAVVVLTAAFFATTANAQSILDPNDPIVVYNPAAPPANPPYGTIAKWVKTNRLNWNTSSYKAYYYNGFAFRLKFPKTYNPTAVDGKKYPMIIFFHGLGEKGTIYDNEYSLLHGGEQFKNKVDAGTYDGYILVMQTQNGYWGTPAYDIIKTIIDYMGVNNKLDLFRVVDNGLSAGGAGSWDMLIANPTYIAAALPMSASCICYNTSATINKIKFTPIWNFQGALDPSPSPSTTEQVRDAILNAGGNFRYTKYPNLAHGTWNTAWAEPDFYPYALKANSANPWTLFGRTEFCPGDAINVTIGLAPGFAQYEWRKNGTLITGATGSTITVTGSAVAGNAALGVYSARVRRGTVWSDWSPVPVDIKIKAPTVPPTITVSGMMSKVIPDLDGKTSVTLQVPAVYQTYLWQKEGSATTISTASTVSAASPGNYKVKVTEQFGCSTEFSAPFTVIDANGPNKPDAAINLLVATLSKTSLRLDWSDNPTPQNNETNFEIYRSTVSGGSYTLVGITNADVLTFTDNGLTAKTKYYYKIRAVNNTGASPASNEANGTTDADVQPPTAPSNLIITGTSSSSVSLGWGASTDDVGVSKYDVYVNGLKSYVTDQTNFTVYNLQLGQSYNFSIKARDAVNNVSPASNQVTGQPLQAGLPYKYYTYPTTTSWTKLPDFSTLVPVANGVMPSIALTPRTQNDRFAFLWEGYINIPVSGIYSFRTTSNEGSKLWLGPLNGTTSPYSYAGAAVVSNDSIHSSRTRTSSLLMLNAGRYPIAIAFFDQTGSETMTVSWQTPSTGLSFVNIPASAFADVPVVSGSAPAAPSGLAATAVSYKRINLAWSDNSNNETGFEIWRSTNATSGFVIIGQTAANATAYVDSAVNASTTYYYNVRAIGQFGESKFTNGVDYAYYEVSNMSALPDFNTLTPKKTGSTASFVLGQQNRADDFAFKFSGTITVPVSGIYTFYTTSDDGSKLYIDGFDEAHKVVHNDYLQGPTERSGAISLTAGTHAIYATFFEKSGGEFFEVRYQGPGGSGIAKQLIPSSVLRGPYPNATTSALPPSPSAPAGLSATGVSNSKIGVSWTDVADETSYELYRSANNNGNYLLFAKLPANTVSYIDSGLFANSVNYYKVRAVNAGGPSAYSNEDSAKTVNNIPVLSPISNQFMRFGTQLQLNISAADLDPETVTITTTNLPAFGSFAPTGNGTGVLSFTNPADQGSYNGIIVTATDQQGGSSSISFNLVVNDNYLPVIAPVSNATVNEQQTAQVNLSATDQNAADVLTWNFTGLPSFAVPVVNAGSVQINLAPGLADHGQYNVTASVSDGNNGVASTAFVINVNDVNPNKKTYINFTDGTYSSPAPWNNTNKATPSFNDNFPNLLDETGTNSGIGLLITSPWQNLGNAVNTYGANTGNNSGVYPDNVIRSCYFTTNVSQTIKIYGLNPAFKYNFTFLGSRGSVADDRTTTYSIGSNSVSLNAANNTQNTVGINNLLPDPDGSLTLTLSKGGASSYGYLNAMVIESLYDDGTAPAKPRNAAATLLSNNNIRVSWIDAAYNENAYEVYRSSTNLPGSYVLLNPGGNNANLQLYNDANTVGNSTYYYFVKAVNTVGSSPASDTVSITVPNGSPVLAAIANVVMKTQQVVNVNVSASDAAGDIITLTATGLPSFATFTDNGNGTGVFNIAPGNTMGIFPGITVTASDNFGGNTSKQFSISVSDKDISAYYVNFNQVLPAASPWNNFNSLPAAGTTISNIKDEIAIASGISVTLVDAWDNANDLGATTGNNTGVYPDDVMKTAYFTNATTAKRIRISGLSTAAGVKYNLIFFASRGGVNDNRNTTYSYNGQSVTLNAASNTLNTVKLQGVVPDASGIIEFTALKDAAAGFGYINALVIQSYVDNGLPVAPVSLTAVAKSASSIQLNWVDKSSNEDGFEVYRSSAADGTYTLVTTTAANVTSYLNSGLSAGTYYYKVRAKKLPNLFSAYSNIAGSSTVEFSVYLNFNQDNPAGAPWNNTNEGPIPDDVYSNLNNSLSNPTGINMTVLGTAFNGVNIYGVNTGNNSGIYPDKVISQTWWLDANNIAMLRIDGLSIAKKFNFTFFASRVCSGCDRTTVYTIGNRSVSLNAASNSSNIVTITNITPDENGSALIEIKAGGASPFAYIGALVIEAYTGADDGGGSGAPLLINNNTGLLGRTGGNNPAGTRLGTEIVQARADKNKIAVYPNPFTSDLTLNLSFVQSVERLNVIVTDISGKTVYSKELRNVPQGISYQKIGLNGSNLKHGIYLVRISGLPDNKTQSFKVIKID